MNIKKEFSKGFTLLELLVVIAIISILAAIVIMFVNTSRARAQDSRTKTVLSDVRTVTQGEKLSGASYTAIFADPQSETTKELQSLSEQADTTYQYYADEDTYAVVFPLKSEDGYWCVDANGNSQQVPSSTPQGTTYDCNAFIPATELDLQQRFVCDYAAPPLGCNYIHGPNYDPVTMCGMVLNCPDGFPHGGGILFPGP